MAKKASSFSSFLAGTPMITVNRLKGSDNYQSWANSITLWFTGNGVEDHPSSMESSVDADKRPQWRKHDALLCNILQQSIKPKTLDNLRDYQTCQPIWTQAKNLYTNDVQRLYRVISSVDSLEQLHMELSSFVRRMSALKNELLFVLPKVTNVETYLSNMDQIFMILTLIKLGIEFDNIREQILIGSTIPTFDDIFAQLLHHSSTATWSRSSKVSNETSVMLAPSHPRGGYRGSGQRPHYTYCDRPSHIQDRCYQLHGRPPCTAHVA